MSSLLNDSMFWTVGVGGLLIGIIGITIKYVYKIKCSDCTFCFGCIKCTRNIDVELQEDTIPQQYQNNDSPSGTPFTRIQPTTTPRSPQDIFSRV
jgi:hypothetical protein